MCCADAEGAEAAVTWRALLLHVNLSGFSLAYTMQRMDADVEGMLRRWSAAVRRNTAAAAAGAGAAAAARAGAAAAADGNAAV